MVIHGLNLRPDKMDSLSQKLVDLNFDVARLTLKGHGSNDLQDFKSVTAQDWTAETDAAHLEISKRAQLKKYPKFFLGFSIGSILGVNLQLKNRDFEKLILLSPPFKAKWYSNLLRLFSIFPSLCIPSASLEAYRVHDCTPIAGYSALFEISDRISDQDLLNFPTSTLMVIDPKDEVVDFDYLDWVSQKNEKFKLLSMSVLPTDNATRHHLIVDEASTGNLFWTKMGQAISNFLGENKF